jgi:hypothetical protein
MTIPEAASPIRISVSPPPPGRTSPPSTPLRVSQAGRAAIGGQPSGPAEDHLGRNVTYTTAEFRGETYDVTVTQNKVSKLGRFGRVVLAPLAAVAGVAAFVGGSGVDKTYWKEYFTQSIGEGSFTTERRMDKVALTAETSTKKYGFDINNQEAIQEEIETARSEGRLLRQNHHQYILLKNSAAIIIPNGKPEEASVRTFWGRDDGKNYDNSDTLERIVQCYLLAYDSIDKNGGHLDDTLVFDLDTKTVRGFYHQPDPNKHLDSLSFADKYYDVDSSVMDSMRNKWDPEKVDSKTPLHGDKVESNKRKRDEDDAVPNLRRKRRRSEGEDVSSSSMPPRTAAPTGERSNSGPTITEVDDEGNDIPATSAAASSSSTHNRSTDSKVDDID